MKKIGVYTHGGSGNHGCEALVRTLMHLIPEHKITVYSQRPLEDKKYIQDSEVDFVLSTHKSNLFEKVLNKVQCEEKRIQRYYAPTIRGAFENDIMISIGGDNYCYEDYRNIPGVLRKKFPKNCKTILFGCSIDENALTDEKVIEDLQQYDLITVRESLTFDLLKKALPNTNIKLYPDSAFLLPKDESISITNMVEYVGLNISPMVLKKEYSDAGLMDNVIDLIEYILVNTKYSILLIPHVIWEGNDDRIVLEEIYKRFETYKDRMICIDDASCCQLKGLISKCKYFIGARTHATIAAYSTFVPTIVLGYSIKSKGIAYDIFGEDENYVVPVNNLDKGTLVNKFMLLENSIDKVSSRLKEKIPAYIEDAEQVKKALDEIINS